MDTITVNFSNVTGKVKPLHATNNGPVHKFHTTNQSASNLQSFIDAGIPYCRTHDAAFYATYGGEHTVDVNNIFTDWNADPYAPESYDFVLTDEYLKCIAACGAKIFYRLGSKIEHWVKKYNTAVPKDFKKWAIVCEHIIRHYTEGWSNGFFYEGTYWEIWNEPDLDADDSTNKRNWQGTTKQFIELFNVTYKHLKSCFPTLKIGGPAVAWFGHLVRGSGDPEIEGRVWADVFLERLEQKPDFFSWHIYGHTIEKVRDSIRTARKLMDEHGCGFEVESILNEWNYVRDWTGDAWDHSKLTWRTIKGAAFVAAVMEMSQYEPLDMLMYYDARPGAMNCLFDPEIVDLHRKGYYAFWMFNQLYRQGKAVEVKRTTSDVWAVAAKGEEHNVMLTYFNDNANAPSKEVKVEFNNVKNENGVKLEYYLLDENNDAKLVREEKFTSTNFAAYVNMTLYSSYLLKIVKL